MSRAENQAKKPNESPETGSTAADRRRLEILVQAHRHLDTGDLLGCLLDACLGMAGLEYGVAFAFGEDLRALTPVAGRGGPERAPHDSFHPLKPAAIDRWAPETLTVFDGLGPFEAVVEDWPGPQPAHLVAVRFAGRSERMVGLVLLAADRPVDAEVLGRIEDLTVAVRPAVDNSLHVLDIRELVIKDDTARCFNRRHFEEFLPEELARAARFRSPVSLIFLDMDNLKQVNNEFGHAMGSRTLYEVSVRIRSKIRKFDKLFRFGGDEFCIVLPETEWHGAMEVAERVRDAVASQHFLKDQPSGRGGVRMTASLGVASYPLHARTRTDLIERADRAMQRIKSASKNAIGIAKIEEGEGDQDERG